MAKKPGRPLTPEERDKIEEETFKDGGFEIIRNGQRLRMDGNGNFIPVKGSDAQQAIKKQRKPRKPKSGE